MITPRGSVKRVHALDDSQIEELADVLIDCVEGGASVSFMHPLPRDRAVAFWRAPWPKAWPLVNARCWLLTMRKACGTVQLVLDQPENQPHRADLSKMLVHRRARRQGLGQRCCEPPKLPRANAARRCWCSIPPATMPNACTSAWVGNASV